MKVICEICEGDFQAQHSRPHGDRCNVCAGWLRVLGKGPKQEEYPDEDYEKLGMVIAYLIKQGELKEKTFIHGLIQGIKKT